MAVGQERLLKGGAAVTQTRRVNRSLLADPEGRLCSRWRNSLEQRHTSVRQQGFLGLQQTRSLHGD